jgi:hypothetical protein
MVFLRLLIQYIRPLFLEDVCSNRKRVTRRVAYAVNVWEGGKLEDCEVDGR